MRDIARVFFVFAASALLALATGCSGGDGEGDGTAFAEGSGRVGDLADIHRKGELRIVAPVLSDDRHLPRAGSPLAIERELIESYTRQRGLSARWIYVDSRDRLLPALLEGVGDVVVANLTATPERRQQVLFTVPIGFVREQIVARAEEEPFEDVTSLRGRRVAVRRSSSYWWTLQDLRKKHPFIEIWEVPEDLGTTDLIHQVGRRRYELTVADSNVVEATLEYREDVRPVLDLTGDRPVAWAVRPGSTELQRDLDRFLTEVQLADRRDAISFGDLQAVRERKVLRILTRNSPSTYFLWRGELMGFDYELARRFAEQQGAILEVVVPPRSEDLLPWLVAGRADIVAAGIIPTPARAALGVAFSRPYNYASPMLVTRAEENDLTELADLRDRSLVVPRGSSHWHEMEEMHHRIGFDLMPAPAPFDIEEIIALVADGTYDLTVADSHVLDIELTWRSDVSAAMPIGDPLPLTWAVRAQDSQLLSAVNEFIDREYRGLFYNVVYNRYFKNPKRIRTQAIERLIDAGRISPYDELIRLYADEHGFDWRLIAAQMFQESRFDPEAQSFAGAVGLLQVLPRTGRQLGFEKLEDPEENIAAGVAYLAWLRDLLEDDLSVRDKTWFTLASYNAGRGHLLDARSLAAEKGWDANRWFGHVERAMLLLSRAEYARKARNGYCRGSEPVNYVRAIQARYNAYIDSLQEAARPRQARTARITRPLTASAGAVPAIAQDRGAGSSSSTAEASAAILPQVPSAPTR